MPWLFFVLDSSLVWGVTPTLRDFKGDIKVSLRQKNWIQTPTQTQKDFLMIVLITLMRIKKPQHSKGSSNYVFAIVITWVKSSMDETSIQT
jgi:hypothetical protein